MVYGDFIEKKKTTKTTIIIPLFVHDSYDVGIQ